MPKRVESEQSPFERGAREGAERPSDGRSSAGSRAKRKPKPTGRAKNRKQKVKKRYSSAREEAQLHDVIPTTPDGAVRDEVSRGGGEVAFPRLVSRAVREGWLNETSDVSRHIKEMTDIIEDPLAKDKDRIAAFKALTALTALGLRADQREWERANPAQAGQAKGAATVAVSVQNNVLAAQVMREALESGFAGSALGLSAPGQPSGIGESRFDGEVETCAASTSDKRGAGGGVDDPEQPDPDYRPIPTR